MSPKEQARPPGKVAVQAQVDEPLRTGDRSPDSAAAVIYLARHGRTALNAAGVLRGRLDPPLDEVGAEEAERLASALADRGIELVVASPLRRAVETAEAVALRLGLEVEADERLADRDYGPWAGRALEEAVAQWGSVDSAPGVEPASELTARVVEALEELADRCEGSVALAVSHDAVTRSFLATIGGERAASYGLALATGCFSSFERRGRCWSVLEISELPR